MSRGTSAAAVGLTIKSGWACAVLVTGSRATPAVADTCRVDLSDPTVPEAKQPFHDGFATERTRGPELTRLLASVKQYGQRSVLDLIDRHCALGHRLRGAGLVVGSLIDPESIGNEHIRIHAREGQLFRTVVADAAARRDLACEMWRERDIYETAQAVLKQSRDELHAALSHLGRGVTGPWRAEHKNAALAAWLVLARRR
jgi:hypothetical protein